MSLQIGRTGKATAGRLGRPDRGGTVIPSGRKRFVKIAEHTAAWRHLLSKRDFRWLWVGQLISQFGDGLTKVALLWFVYKLTGSALKMTVIGVLQTIPPLFLGPLAGVYLDRLPKRATMMIIDLARAGLLVLIPLLYTFDLLSLTLLYALVFITALFSMAFGPALNATVPLVARQDELTTANAIMQSCFTVGQVLGPALSGILITVIGAPNVLSLNAAAFFVSALCKIPLRLPQESSRGGRLSSKVVWHDLREGFGFVFVQRRMLLLLMVMASLFTMGATGYIFLLPVIGERILHVESVGVGYLWSAYGGGFLVTTIWLALQEHVTLLRQLLMISGSALIGGLSVLILVWQPPIIVAAALNVAIGGSSALLLPIVSAILQQASPKDLLARVFGVFNTGTMAFAMIGMMVFGWIADRFHALMSLTGIAAVNLTTTIVTLLLIPWCLNLARTSGNKSCVTGT
jgi:MFS transporter, DHA3 family, macrolide efflux protein